MNLLRLTRGEMSLLDYLKRNHDGDFDGTIRTISKRLHVSESTLHRSISRLMTRGIIVKDTQKADFLHGNYVGVTIRFTEAYRNYLRKPRLESATSLISSYNRCSEQRALRLLTILDGVKNDTTPSKTGIDGVKNDRTTSLKNGVRTNDPSKPVVSVMDV